MDTARLGVLRGVTCHMATADNVETVLRSITTALVEHADATVAHIFLYLRDDECPVCSKAAASRQQVVDGPPALHLLAGAGVPFGVGLGRREQRAACPRLTAGSRAKGRRACCWLLTVSSSCGRRRGVGVRRRRAAPQRSPGLSTTVTGQATLARRRRLRARSADQPRCLADRAAMPTVRPASSKQPQADSRDSATSRDSAMQTCHPPNEWRALPARAWLDNTSA
jgi:hypothetical protein